MGLCDLAGCGRVRHGLCVNTRRNELIGVTDGTPGDRDMAERSRESRGTLFTVDQGIMTDNMYYGIFWAFVERKYRILGLALASFAAMC